MSTLIDYTFATASVANPDSTRPAAFAGATVVTGPGATALGALPHAIALAGGAPPVTVDLSGLSPDRTRFTVDVVFKLDAAPTSPQPILSSALLPFALTAVPADGGYAIEATIGLATPALSGVRTATAMKPGTWHTATLAYDLDTLSVFVDHAIEAVHASPAGAVAAAGGATLTVGSGPVSLAAIRWQDDIDPALETQLDDRRDGAEWAITFKREQLGAALALGDAQGALAQDPATGAWIQHYAAGLIMWSEATGVACEMHGSIWGLYVSLDDIGPLGVLITDEIAGNKAGSRRSTFTAGTIYWSAATGAVPVVGHLYVDYERLGGPGGVLGLPTAFSSAVNGGLEQVFEAGRMYYRNGDGAAHEVHGAILGQFLATGGVGTWGFPLTDEVDATSNGTAIGRLSDFAGATFYWSGGTGAHEVHGAIRDYYRQHAGAASELGLPTSDEMDIPGGSGRMNTFIGGALLWNGAVTWVHPFQLFVGRIDTVEEEGAFMGQNDVYGRVTVTQAGATLYNQRQPGSGDSDDHNVVDWNLTIPPHITPTLETVTLTIDLWDSDDGAPFGGGDDHLGAWHIDLNPANAWGLGINGGIIDSGKFADVNSVQVSVKPLVDTADLQPAELWWGVKNRGTDSIPYPLYAAAFEDVDSAPEWWDAIDWLDKAYYAAVAEHIARGGNCFGMSLAGIDALKGTGPYSLPLNRFQDWNSVVQQFNVRHQYQVGAAPIWWFVEEFLSGATHSPKEVFTNTRDAHNRGDNPVLCLSQKSDFSGAPHCIMPVGWDDSAKPWKIMVQDPNFPASAPRPLLVDPDADTYHYDGGNIYDGTSDSGGRLHWMPYHLLSHQQDTPIGELLALLLAGTIIIMAEGTDSSGITDADGNDLDASGTRAAAELVTGSRLGGYFMPVRGMSDTRRITSSAAVGATTIKATEQTIAQKVTAETMAAGTHAATVDEAQGKLGDRVVVLPPIMIQQSDPVAGGLLMRPGAVIRDAVLKAKPKRVFLPPKVGTVATATLHVATSVSGGEGATGAGAESPSIRIGAAQGVRVTGSTLSAATVRQVAVRSPQSVLADPGIVAQLDPAVIGALGSLVAPKETDFVHHVTGTGADFDYIVKHGLTEIRVMSPLTAGERTSLAVTGLGGAKAVVGLTAATAKTATVRIEHRLGLGGDRLAIQLEQLPVGPGSDLQVNVKPGIAGVEVIAGGDKIDVPVSIEGIIGGRRVGGTFAVPLDGGLRLAPSSLLASGSLRVAQIAAMFGPAAAVSDVAPA